MRAKRSRYRVNSDSITQIAMGVLFVALNCDTWEAVAR